MTTFADELRQTFGDDEDGRATMRDLATYGASGGFPGLTYYTDTVALHDRHEDEIWDALYEDAESFGQTIPELIASFGSAKDVGTLTQLKNLLVWYMAERVARSVADEEEDR
jgi:hypothetical protein